MGIFATIIDDEFVQADFGLVRIMSNRSSATSGADEHTRDNPYSEHYIAKGGQFAPRWTAPEAATVNGRFSEVGSVCDVSSLAPSFDMRVY
jgi:hypothetical protein